MRHGAGVRPKVVDVIALGGLRVVRIDAQADPDAAVLHGQGDHVVQCGMLVAVHAGTVGEAGEQLVFPGLAEPWLGGRVGELLELPADASHVGRRAEDDRVGRRQLVPTAFRQVAVRIDDDEPAVRAFGHSLRQPLGVAVAGVVNDCDACHGVLSEVEKKRGNEEATRLGHGYAGLRCSWRRVRTRQATADRR